MHGYSSYAPNSYRNNLIPTSEVLVEAPLREPVDLEMAKKHLRFDSTTEDALIDGWISAARQLFEENTHRQIINATWEYWLDAFPAWGIELPHSPLQSIVSVKYIDGNGVEQTWNPAEYQVTAPIGPNPIRGWLCPAYGFSWPSTRCQPAAVKVRYISGWGNTPSDVPELVRNGLYILIGSMFCGREAVKDPQADTLFRIYRADQKRPPEWC